MKITVSRGELLYKLRLAGKIIQSSKYNPDLENFLFEIKEGLLFVTGADDGGRMTTSVDCQLTDVTEHAFTANAKDLLGALKELSEQPLVLDVKFKDTCVAIISRYANGKFEIVGGIGILSNFPVYSTNEEDSKIIRISSLKLLNGLKHTHFCAANDELRPVMNGVFVDRSEAGITFVASDGRSLAMVKYVSSSPETCSFILPSRMAKILTDTISAEDYLIKISVGSRNVLIEHRDWTLTARLIEGNYPNYRAVIPASNDKILIVDRQQALSAIKRVSVFASDATSLLRLKLEKDKLSLSTQDYDYSTSAEEEVSAEYSGSDFEIGLNCSYLLNILPTINAENIELSFSDPSRAVLIKENEAVEGEELTYLIMPLILNQ